MAEHDNRDPSAGNINRRGFLRCMAWAGAGVLWTVRGGILTSRALGADLAGRRYGTPVRHAPDPKGDFSFVQISDSHIGFSNEVNKDVTGTLQLAIDRINATPAQADLLIHTGDLTHFSKPKEFDTVDQILRGAKVGSCSFVPGEHDVFTDDGKSYLERFGKGTQGRGWHCYDHKGVRFIGLVNVTNLENGALGVLGQDQLDWLKKVLESPRSSMPIVVFAHVPLWTVFPKWGWGTRDSERALSLLKRFSSVTVLNGHIHQVMQKVEGNITFHTACSTAYPQPAPGTAESPGPMQNVPAEKLRSMLGLTSVRCTESKGTLALVDKSLA